MATPRSKEDLSLGELFAELTRELTTLVRQELALATTEMTQKGSRVGRHVGSLARTARAARAIRPPPRWGASRRWRRTAAAGRRATAPRR